MVQKVRLRNVPRLYLRADFCKADGASFTIVRHLGVRFADDEDLSKLKESILNQLLAGGYNYYYAIGNGRKQIGTDDLQIVVATQQANEDSQNNCYVYAQLTDAAKSEDMVQLFG